MAAPINMKMVAKMASAAEAKKRNVRRSTPLWDNNTDHFIRISATSCRTVSGLLTYMNNERVASIVPSSKK